jgi:hypothetical protein
VHDVLVASDSRGVLWSGFPTAILAVGGVYAREFERP